MDSSHVCTICSSEHPSYKCPVCRLPYCSAQCCQTHRSSCVAPEAVQHDTTVDRTEQRVRWEESADHLVSSEALSWLGDSVRLRRLLASPHLRALVRQADSTDRPEDELRRLMVEPLFVEFTDECLRVVEGRPEPDADE